MSKIIMDFTEFFCINKEIRSFINNYRTILYLDELKKSIIVKFLKRIDGNNINILFKYPIIEKDIKKCKVIEIDSNYFNSIKHISSDNIKNICLEVSNKNELSVLNIDTDLRYTVPIETNNSIYEKIDFKKDILLFSVNNKFSEYIEKTYSSLEIFKELHIDENFIYDTEINKDYAKINKTVFDKVGIFNVNKDYLKSLKNIIILRFYKIKHFCKLFDNYDCDIYYNDTNKLLTIANKEFIVQYEYDISKEIHKLSYSNILPNYYDFEVQIDYSIFNKNLPNIFTTHNLEYVIDFKTNTVNINTRNDYGNYSKVFNINVIKNTSSVEKLKIKGFVSIFDDITTIKYNQKMNILSFQGTNSEHHFNCKRYPISINNEGEKKEKLLYRNWGIDTISSGYISSTVEAYLKTKKKIDSFQPNESKPQDYLLSKEEVEDIRTYRGIVSVSREGLIVTRITNDIGYKQLSISDVYGALDFYDSYELSNLDIPLEERYVVTPKNIGETSYYINPDLSVTSI
jgi:hypothetical protein